MEFKWKGQFSAIIKGFGNEVWYLIRKWSLLPNDSSKWFELAIIIIKRGTFHNELIAENSDIIVFGLLRVKAGLTSFIFEKFKIEHSIPGTSNLKVPEVQTPWVCE